MPKSKISKSTKIVRMFNLSSPRGALLLFVSIFVFSGLAALVVSHAATPCTSNVFVQGSSGQCVKDIQHILNKLKNDTDKGYISTAKARYTGPYLAVDGKYGPQTTAQVKIFQNWYNNFSVGGTKLVVDGKVGPKTWNGLCYEIHFIYYPQTSYNALGYMAGVNAGCK